MRTDTLAGPVRKVRRPLLLLLGAVAAFVVAWSLFVPPFQVPDEQAHFGYVQSLAERHERPHGGGRNSPRHLSTEEKVARGWIDEAGNQLVEFKTPEQGAATTGRP